MSSRPDLGERLARILLRAFPSRFRRRYGRDVAAAMERAGADRRAPLTGAHVLVDALATLPRAWVSELRYGVPRIVAFARDGVTRDARVALRGARRSPGPTIVSVATLALALGGNAAVFSVTYAVLMRSLPYDDPDRIVTVRPDPVSLRMADGGVDWTVSRVLREAPSVSASAVTMEHGRANFETPGGAQQVSITQVSDAFFEVLGVRPVLGSVHAFGADDVPSAVLSYDMWSGSLGRDSSVVGRNVRLSGRTYRVAAVLAPDVDVPRGTDLWLSLPTVPEFYGAAAGPTVLARLRPGVEYHQANVELAQRARAAASARGDTVAARELPVVAPIRDALTGAVRLPLLALWSASVLVLVLGCVNVAGVMLARLARRADELSVRTALGASRARIFRLLFLDAALPALGGGLVAVGVAVVVAQFLEALLPAGLPGLATAGPGVGAIAALAAMTALAATLVGGLVGGAGVAGLRRRRTADMRTSGRGVGRLQSVLSVAEVTLAVMLAVSAGLLGRNLAALRAIPIGFDTGSVLTFEARLPDATHATAASWQSFVAGVLSRLEAHPFVAAVGVSGRLPLSDGYGRGVRIWSDDGSEAGAHTVTLQSASSAYFNAMGVRTVAGRLMSDGVGAANEVVVGESAAVRLFGSAGSAVGARLRLRRTQQQTDVVTVVGVVQEVRQHTLLGEQSSHLYEPWHVAPVPWPGFAVRAIAGTDPSALTALVRTAVSETHPAIAPQALRTTRESAAELLATERALALLSAVFGAFALVLAALGVYGVVAQLVAQRRREIGIRLALGAPRAHVASGVVQHAVGLAATGALVGTTLALGGARFLASLLEGVSAYDPITFAAAPFVAVAVAVLAALPPAVRAARTDPMRSLRSE